MTSLGFGHDAGQSWTGQSKVAPLHVHVTDSWLPHMGTTAGHARPLSAHASPRKVVPGHWSGHTGITSGQNHEPCVHVQFSLPVLLHTAMATVHSAPSSEQELPALAVGHGLEPSTLPPQWITATTARTDKTKPTRMAACNPRVVPSRRDEKHRTSAIARLRMCAGLCQSRPIEHHQMSLTRRSRSRCGGLVRAVGPTFAAATSRSASSATTPRWSETGVLTTRYDRNENAPVAKT